MAINNSARLSDLEITWLGISSNLRAGPSESNVLVHPESLGADDKGQCGRAWRLASLLASHLTSDQDGVFGPIFLFGASLAPALLVFLREGGSVATSSQRQLTCTICPTSTHQTTLWPLIVIHSAVDDVGMAVMCNEVVRLVSGSGSTLSVGVRQQACFPHSGSLVYGSTSFISGFCHRGSFTRNDARLLLTDPK